MVNLITYASNNFFDWTKSVMKLMMYVAKGNETSKVLKDCGFVWQNDGINCRFLLHFFSFSTKQITTKKAEKNLVGKIN
jgi:hypothetical protein